jgi:hypothetical protein
MMLTAEEWFCTLGDRDSRGSPPRFWISKKPQGAALAIPLKAFWPTVKLVTTL